ncbi:18364_t:CDS:10, partial [Racocetra fulgida]
MFNSIKAKFSKICIYSFLQKKRRKRLAREAHSSSAFAQKVHGLRAKLYNKKQKSAKQKDTQAVPDGAIPTYLLDREGQQNAKILSNMVKQKRKEKAGKWTVPLPKVRGIAEDEMFRVIKTGKNKTKQWKRMVTKATFVGEGFTRKPPKYERFIRPMALRYKKAHVTHPELGATFYLPIISVKKNPQSPLYTQLGVITKGTVIEINVSELGLVTTSGKVVWGKYAQGRHLKDDFHAEEYKTLGNQAFSAKEYEKAIECFSKAIELDPSNHVLYSNRSASYSSLKKYDKALEDANKTVELKSDWVKGYSRKGAALHGLGKIQEARETYQEGLKIDPNNAQLKKSLEDLERAEKALMFLLTGEMNFPQEPQETEKPAEPEPKTRDVPEPEPEHVEKSEEELKKEEAVKEKNLGNEAYKKREFETALQHYDKAWELDPTNVSILTNKAAVLFEQENYEECIKICEQAVDVGRENRADFKLIARAYGRIGNAYVKLDKLDDAIKYYGKSLAEHRTPEILTKSNEIKKLKDKREKESYYNPELSEKAREAGNELFKKNDFAGAVQQYTEAIKRNENDPKSYSNRAACYTKLMAFPEALKDCETCISLDPTFEIQGQMRKCQEAMYQNSPESVEETIRKAASDPEIMACTPMMNLIVQLNSTGTNDYLLCRHLKNPTVKANIE